MFICSDMDDTQSFDSPVQSEDEFSDELMWDYMCEDDDELDILLNQEPETKQRKLAFNRKPNIKRDFVAGHARLYADYFAPNPVYGPALFHRRFRMSKSLFETVCNKLVQTDSFFVQRRDATGKMGASTLQKATAAIRMLAYGCSSDSLDEYLRMSETLIWKP